MPAAQVINFGEDPYANAMGGFAKSFLGTLNENQGQRRNDDIFKKVMSKYGPDAEPEMIYRDIANAEGLSQDYKRDKLKETLDLATLKSKKTQITPYQQAMIDIREQELNIKKANANKPKEKPLTDYQQEVLANARIRLEKQELQLKQAAERESAKFPKLVADYTNSQLKGADKQLSIEDKADLNGLMERLLKDKKNPVSTPEAFQSAYQMVTNRREQIDDAAISKKPYWSRDIPMGEEQAYNELLQLKQQFGLTEKELKKKATSAG
jgi:hypothetical protein